MIFHCGLFLLCLIVRINALEPGSDVDVVQAVVGETGYIPCNVSTPLEDDEASLILWYRVDMPNPIYTLDIRNVPMKNARHFPSEEMEGRAYFNISVHPPLLVLTPVLTEDEADYKCRVDLRRSRTLILHSRLRLIIPPSEPIIMDEHGQRLHDVIGPYDEGSTLTFICEVDGGDPSPNVTWWKGPFLLDDDFNATKQGFVRNEFVVHKIQRSDWMTEYACKASNTHLAKPKVSSIQLDINLLPTHVKLRYHQSFLIAGDKHEITCETRGSRPRALTTWWLNGHKIGVGTQETIREGGNLTLSILHFTPTPEDNGKRLICKSANPALPKTTIEDGIFLKVHYIPIVNISFGSSMADSKVKEGNDVYLECSIRANPWVFEIEWHFEDRTLTTNRTAGIIISNQTLLLQNVGKKHRGRYRCLATNTVGQGRSNYQYLLVQFTPVCSFTEPQFYGVTTGETVNVTCEVEADPSNVVFRWSINNSLDTTLLRNWSNDGTRSVISYSPQILRNSGFGNLLCWARNSLGIQKEPCVIKVVPAGAPESPHDCVITNHTSQSLLIECEAGYNGSLPQMFHMEIYNSIVEHMVDNITKLDKPTFLIRNLSPGTSYVLVIYASNVKGRSNSVALVTSTPFPAEKRTAQHDQMQLSPVLVILIGVIALFVISAVVIVIIIRSHIPKENASKDAVDSECTNDCDREKKDLEESQESASEKGPDIIPESKESEVFFTGRVTDSPATEYVHQKYLDTAL